MYLTTYNHKRVNVQLINVNRGVATRQQTDPADSKSAPVSSYMYRSLPKALKIH